MTRNILDDWTDGTPEQKARLEALFSGAMELSFQAGYEAKAREIFWQIVILLVFIKRY